MDMKELADAEQQWLDIWARGPQRVRWDRIPLQVGDPAPDLELPDHNGIPTRLSSLWRDQPAVVMFWRHFGCSCGRDRARRLRDEYAELTALGATVTIIGQAGPERAARYRDENQISCTILSDPDETAYLAYDVLEGTTAQVLFDAPDELLACDLPAGIALAASRHDTAAASVDNPFLLPAEFVILNGIVQLAYRYQYCEDWPDPRALTAAIRFPAAASSGPETSAP
jgi:peroxiredoxin